MHPILIILNIYDKKKLTRFFEAILEASIIILLGYILPALAEW